MSTELELEECATAPASRNWQVGFRVRRFIDLTNWKAAPASEMEWVGCETCPVDGGTLQIVASLVCQRTRGEIRVGCCDSCGHVTYLDKPTPESVDRFYAERWMGDTPSVARHKAVTSCGQAKPYGGLPGDRSLPALDIGCGYGNGMVSLVAEGFRDVRGLEACPVRAQAAQEASSRPVASMPLESLPEAERYGLLMSHHVLEHIHDPAAFIAKCSRLQDDGGYLFLSMPAFPAEPSMGVMLFWPHLHSFTRSSLRALLYRNGYGIACEFPDQHEDLVVIAQKTGGNRPAMAPTDYNAAVSKLRLGLGLEHRPAVMTWQRGFDGVSIEPADHGAQRERFDFPRKVEIESIAEYYTDSPIEIQFSEHLHICHK